MRTMSFLIYFVIGSAIYAGDNTHKELRLKNPFFIGVSPVTAFASGDTTANIKFGYNVSENISAGFTILQKSVVYAAICGNNIICHRQSGRTSAAGRASATGINSQNPLYLA